MLRNSWSLYNKTFKPPLHRINSFGESQEREVTEDTRDSKEKETHLEPEKEQETSNETMGSHRSRRPTSSDSGYDTNSDGPASPQQERSTPPAAREQAKSAISAEAQRVSLSDARRTDLTASIGTQLSGIQISSLDAQQLDDLALLVSERGVVFLREQDLSAEEQSRIFEHYAGVASTGKQIVERRAESVIVKNSPSDYGEKFTFAPDSGNEWVSDGSFEVAPPSYSLFRAEETGGEAVWVRILLPLTRLTALRIRTKTDKEIGLTIWPLRQSKQTCTSLRR